MSESTKLEARPNVVVIGGGPAGSTVSTLLAQKGYKVELFEREHFPRFHIGESMIPNTYCVLKRPGMLEKMKTSHFVKKYSVQFINQHGKLSEPFYFMDNKPHESSQTWQVRRSEFDKLMLDHARENGVKVHEGARVLEVLFEGKRAVGVRVKLEDGTEREVRCEGRRRRQRPELAHHRPVRPARVGPGAEEGGAVDLLEGGVPRHRPRRGRHARHPDRGQEGLVLVHPAARRHHQRRRRRGPRLPVQEPRHEGPRDDLLRGGGALPGPAAAHRQRRRAATSSASRRNTRTAPSRRPATAGCSSATPSASSTRSTRRACCSR